MKAVPVLLCLALAHGISASIFKQVDSFDDQQLEYIDEFQQHRNQPSERESQEQNYQQVRDEQERDQIRTLAQDLERGEEQSQPRPQPDYQQPEQNLDQQLKQQPHNLLWNQSGKITFKDSSEDNKFRQPTEETKYRQPNEENKYRQPSEENKYRQPSEENKYRQPSEENKNRQPSAENKYRQPSEENKYRQPSGENKYRQPSEENKYRQPSEENKYRQTSEENKFRQPSEENKYRQPTEDTKYRQPTEENKYRQPLEKSQYVQQPEESQYKQQPEESKHQSQYSQPEQYQQYENTAYQYVKQPSSVQQSQKQDREQYYTHKQTPNAHHMQRNYGLYGNPSNENSQESQEKRRSNEGVKPNSLIDIHRWIPENVKDTLESLTNKKNTYGDVIARNVGKMTVDPIAENVKPNSLIDIHRWIPEKVRDTLESLHSQKNTYGDVITRNVAKMAVDPIAAVQEKVGIEKIFGGALNAIKHVSDEVKDQFHKSFEIAKQQQNEIPELNVTQLAQQQHYPVEEHTIKTDDGYELTLFRIPPKKQIRDVQKRPVVFLMHGIDGSADDWVLMDKSLAFLLSDAGYDVWLGNARGNKYARHHVSKNPAVSDFWQFSIDEIALHDLPAMLDYVLQTAQQEKLYYIGQSLGNTALFALTSTRPEYNDKIFMMYALSPMVYMTNVRSPLMRMISPANSLSNAMEQHMGNGLFSLAEGMIKTAGGALMEKIIGCKEISSNLFFVMAGVNIDDMEPQVIATVMRHLPAGTSTKVIKQYGQGVASHEFRRYNYGTETNKKVYGTAQPPKYDMAKVLAPVTLFYSEEDWLAHPKDVERLENELPNVWETHKVNDVHFSNMDFQFSKKAPEMVYRRLIESMQKNQ